MEQIWLQQRISEELKCKNKNMYKSQGNLSKGWPILKSMVPRDDTFKITNNFIFLLHFHLIKMMIVVYGV